MKRYNLLTRFERKVKTPKAKPVRPSSNRDLPIFPADSFRSETRILREFPETSTSVVSRRYIKSRDAFKLVNICLDVDLVSRKRSSNLCSRSNVSMHRQYRVKFQKISAVFSKLQRRKRWIRCVELVKGKIPRPRRLPINR